ncbi:hypothetical protein VNI00_012393 [Paramarasmius palmivorus]|uniref:Enoyl reductase (ER) domain-containing protein n=1 Tax=Paramarasmius palmivorus TaxID=297713 RepID=A0AAW0C5Q9_9AGAR
MSSKTMKALVYAGVGNYVLQDRPVPKVQLPTDAVVKMVHTTICGTDLHILKGDVATCATGRVLGHEGIAIVQEVGSAVKNFKPGDKVIVSCITACGSCYYCRKNMSGHCADGGWILGHTIDGTQAEYTRIPYADGSLHHCVKGASEEDQVLASDVLPTGYECGVVNGNVEPGSVVAVVGSGPVGLGAVITAQLYSPSTLIVIDLDENRLKTAKKLGATHTIVSGPNTVSEVMNLTNGRGVDTVVEAVGVPKSFELCQDLVAPGGTIANLGVHGCKADLHLEKLWSHNITLRTRLVDAVTSPMLIRLLDTGKLNTEGLITHRFTFREMAEAYKTFGKAAEHNALKILRSLVEGGDFSMASAVREQLISSGRPITPDSVYAQAARNELTTPTSSPIQFENWLRLCPSRSESEPVDTTFKEIIDFLKGSPRERMPWVRSFGMIAASKGYTEIVQKEILPLVWEYGDEEKWSVTNDIRYEMLPKSLPDTVGKDENDLFEDDGNAEYSTHPQEHDNLSFIGVMQQLHKVVDDRKYEEAKMLVRELNAVGYRIPESMVFEKAAIMAVSMNKTVEDIVPDFTHFLSLVPPLHRRQREFASVPFIKTIQTVARRPFFQIQLLQAAALILSSKGYGPLTASLLLPPILRYSDPSDSIRFLNEYETLSIKYIKDRYSAETYTAASLRRFRRPLDLELRLTLRAVREPAIRALADAGYLDVALGLLPSGQSSVKFKLTQYAYSRLRHRMKQQLSTINDPALRQELQGKIDHVQSLHDTKAIARRAPNMVGDKEKTQERRNPRVEDLVRSVRQAKAYFPFHRSHSKTMPLPQSELLVDLITSLQSESTHHDGLASTRPRPRLLALLRRRALSSTYPAASLWLFSEMVYLWRNAEYARVVQLYAKWFWCIGVPRRNVFMVLRSEGEISYDDLEPDTKQKEKCKLYPTKAHNALVWQSLAMLAPNKLELLALYRKLVTFGRETLKENEEEGGEARLNASWPRPSPEADPVLDAVFDSASQQLDISIQAASRTRSMPLVGLGFTHPGSPYFYAPHHTLHRHAAHASEPTFTPYEGPLQEVDPCPIAPEAFTPFIRLFSRGKGARRTSMAAGVLRDMITVGLQPTIHHFGELATVYAVRRKNKGRALKILEGLEAANPIGEDGNITGTSRLPAPDVVTYVALMRAFLTSGDLESVKEVDDRMHRRFGDNVLKIWKECNGSLKEVYSDWEVLARGKGEQANIEEA